MGGESGKRTKSGRIGGTSSTSSSSSRFESRISKVGWRHPTVELAWWPRRDVAAGGSACTGLASQPIHCLHHTHEGLNQAPLVVLVGRRVDVTLVVLPFRTSVLSLVLAHRLR